MAPDNTSFTHGTGVARLALGGPAHRVDFVSGGVFFGAVSDETDLLITQVAVRAPDLIK